MPVQKFFPTYVYAADLARQGLRVLNRQLLKEAFQLREDDAAGRRWSAKNYPGGYTSYGSSLKLQRISPTFKTLEKKLKRHLDFLTAAAEWDLDDRQLVMTDCWLNIMSQQTVHGLHLHPLATVSGTYYVQVPRGSPGIKFEDPRLDRFMAAPPRRNNVRPDNKTWITIPAAAGRVVLFESWLRHEVLPNPTVAERVSISFNYNWF